MEFALKFSARDLGAAGYDTIFGYGFVNADRALRYYAPTADTCGGATIIASDVATQTLNTRFAVGSINDADDTCIGAQTSKSVFYKFNPGTRYGTLNVDTFTSNYDTVLSVYDTCPRFFPGLFGNPGFWIYPSSLGCSDDTGGGAQSQLTSIALSPSNNYVIKVSQYGVFNQSGGDLVLHTSFTPTPPPNDSCNNATIIPSNATTYTDGPYSTTLATTATGCVALDSCGFNNGKDVWYSYTPDAAVTAVFDTQTSTFDTVLSVFNAVYISSCGLNLLQPGGGIICIRPSEVACNDDFNAPERWSQVTVALSAGSKYLIKLNGYGSASGDAVLHMTTTPRACALADVASDSLDSSNNPNGSVGPEDLDAFISGFIAGNAAIADVASDSLDTTYNPNGSVGSEDLDAFIASFIAGC